MKCNKAALEFVQWFTSLDVFVMLAASNTFDENVYFIYTKDKIPVKK